MAAVIDGIFVSVLLMVTAHRGQCMGWKSEHLPGWALCGWWNWGSRGREGGRM